MTDYLDGQQSYYYAIGGHIFEDLLTCHDPSGKELMKICADGRIYWNGREIETDDEFKGCITELTAMLLMKGK